MKHRKRWAILPCLAVLAFISLVPRQITIAAPEVSFVNENSSTVKLYVEAQAKLLGVNPELAICIVTHESQFNPTRLGDDGNSRGLWQISKIYHPEVPDNVAFSEVSSTQWALNWIKQGHIRQWSTYKEYCE
jgi:hypothetical protein